VGVSKDVRDQEHPARVATTGWRFPIALVGNLTYRIFVKRLDHGKGFEMPVNQIPPDKIVAAWQARLEAQGDAPRSGGRSVPTRATLNPEDALVPARGREGPPLSAAGHPDRTLSVRSRSRAGSAPPV